MNIVCISCNLAPAFSRLGHNVRSVTPGPGVVDARTLLADLDAMPDLLFQQEHLGDRTFLSHLEEVPCLKAFWALEAHLNVHWHKYYTRLFDVVFTPHLSLFRHMPPEWTPPRSAPLAMCGHALPWRPHAERRHAMTFVGRDIPATRPLRSRFLKLLGPLGLTCRSGVDHAAMLELYADSRVVPNESIAFEVNYRLTESASAGACVLTTPVGEDQNRLYTPDREILIYEQSLELLEKTAFLRRRPDIAEKIGRAAWEATRARHLPEHRARFVLENLPAAPVRADATALPMTLAQRGRHIHLPTPRPLLHTLGSADGIEAAALHLRCLSEGYPGQHTERFIRARLMHAPVPGEDELTLAALGHALLRADLPLFQAFWTRLHAARPIRPEVPGSLYQAGLSLADELQTRGRLFQPGLAYQADLMTPETALEALYMARRYAGDDPEWAYRLHRLTTRSAALTEVRLEALAALQASAPDWRNQLEYGCALLDAYSAAEGISILSRALVEADALGRGGLARKILLAHRVDSALLNDVLP